MSAQGKEDHNLFSFLFLFQHAQTSKNEDQSGHRCFSSQFALFN